MKHLIRRLRTLCACIALGLGVTIAQQANAQVSQAAPSEAIVITPLTLLNTQPLDFGLIAAGPSAGTVTVSPANVVTSRGGAIPMPSSTQSARFAGLGVVNRIVAIRMVRNQFTLTRSGGSQTMRINNFLIGSQPPTTLSTSRRFFRIGAATGQFNFNVGATLHVGADQQPGTYNGNFAITIDYY